MKGYCQSAPSVTRSEDDWSWSTPGTGLCFYWRWQAAHRWYKFNMDGGWLGRFSRWCINLAWTVDSDKSCCVLRLAPWWWIISLVTVSPLENMPEFTFACAYVSMKNFVITQLQLIHLNSLVKQHQLWPTSNQQLVQSIFVLLCMYYH